MTKEEYNEELEKLQEDFEARKTLISEKYALSNNVVKVGDIVDDKFSKTKIRVNKISWGYSFGDPFCIYEGIVLKDDNTPFETKSDYVCQENLGNHIKGKG